MPTSKHWRAFLIATGALTVLSYAAYRVLNSEQWRQFRFSDLRDSLAGVDRTHLLMAALCIMTSYVARSLRWQIFLLPIKRARLWNLLVATLIGFSSVTLAGRPGEFVRPWLVARKEDLPLSSQLGAWTLERVFDALTISGLLGIALWAIGPAMTLEHPAWMGAFRTAGTAMLILSALLSIFLFQLHYFPRFTGSVVGWFARPLPERRRNEVLDFVRHFATTLGVIRSFWGFTGCIVTSALVWMAVLGAYWSILRGLGAPLAGISLSGMVLVMVATGVGSIAQLPGVGGGTQVGSVVALTSLFGVPLAYATSAALLIWLVTFVMVACIGVPLAAHEGLSWRLLRSRGGAAAELGDDGAAQIAPARPDRGQ